MDILQELGVNFTTGNLSEGLHWRVHNYVQTQARFHEALHALRQSYMIREDPVVVKKFLFPYDYLDVQEVVDFYAEIKAYISEMESEDWIFHRMEEVDEDFNNSSHNDYEDIRRVVYIHALIKSDDQPTTYEQEQALRLYKITRRDFEQAREGLEYEMRKFANEV